MAELRVHNSDTVLTSPDDIQAFVASHGLAYEHWNIDRLNTPEGAQRDGESPQERVLRVFASEVDSLKERGGYQSADVISLTPQTPDLDGLLAKFDKEHLHTEDEVRFVVDGRGVFTIHTQDDVVFDVEVHPGDLLVVPTDTWHWFTLCEDKTIKCIRVFETTQGWTPVYRNS